MLRVPSSGTRHSPFIITHHSPLITHHSSLVTHCSSLVVHRSSLVAHRSSLIARVSMYDTDASSVQLQGQSVSSQHMFPISCWPSSLHYAMIAAMLVKPSQSSNSAVHLKLPHQFPARHMAVSFPKPNSNSARRANPAIHIAMSSASNI